MLILLTKFAAQTVRQFNVRLIISRIKHRNWAARHTFGQLWRQLLPNSWKSIKISNKYHPIPTLDNCLQSQLWWGWRASPSTPIPARRQRKCWWTVLGEWRWEQRSINYWRNRHNTGSKLEQSRNIGRKGIRPKSPPSNNTSTTKSKTSSQSTPNSDHSTTFSTKKKWAANSAGNTWGRVPKNWKAYTAATVPGWPKSSRWDKPMRTSPSSMGAH